MTNEQMIFGAATILGAVGMWLMLPRGAGKGKWLGALLALVSVSLIASQTTPLGDWLADGVFYVLAAVTVVAAAATVTSRNPVYSALWFALSLLGTAALFMYQGAQFLGVATVVVYAGAILVTFLFVLMLAQPEGQAFYDRLSWEAMLSSATGAVLVGILTMTISGVYCQEQPDQRPVGKFTEEQLKTEILADQHMAHLGRQLFGRHLMAVEVAGTLLLVALVGTVAIVSQMRASGNRTPDARIRAMGGSR